MGERSGQTQSNGTNTPFASGHDRVSSDPANHGKHWFLKGLFGFTIAFSWMFSFVGYSIFFLQPADDTKFSFYELFYKSPAFVIDHDVIGQLDQVRLPKPIQSALKGRDEQKFDIEPFSSISDIRRNTWANLNRVPPSLFLQWHPANPYRKMASIIATDDHFSGSEDDLNKRLKAEAFNLNQIMENICRDLKIDLSECHAQDANLVSVLPAISMEQKIRGILTYKDINDAGQVGGLGGAIEQKINDLAVIHLKGFLVRLISSLSKRRPSFDDWIDHAAKILLALVLAVSTSAAIATPIYFLYSARDFGFITNSFLVGVISLGLVLSLLSNYVTIWTMNSHFDYVTNNERDFNQELTAWFAVLDAKIRDDEITQQAEKEALARIIQTWHLEHDDLESQLMDLQSTQKIAELNLEKYTVLVDSVSGVKTGTRHLARCTVIKHLKTEWLETQRSSVNGHDPYRSYLINIFSQCDGGQGIGKGFGASAATNLLSYGDKLKKNISDTCKNISTAFYNAINSDRATMTREVPNLSGKYDNIFSHVVNIVQDKKMVNSGCDFPNVTLSPEATNSATEIINRSLVIKKMLNAHSAGIFAQTRKIALKHTSQINSRSSVRKKLNLEISNNRHDANYLKAEVIKSEIKKYNTPKGRRIAWNSFYDQLLGRYPKANLNEIPPPTIEPGGIHALVRQRATNLLPFISIYQIQNTNAKLLAETFQNRLPDWLEGTCSKNSIVVRSAIFKINRKSVLSKADFIDGFERELGCQLPPEIRVFFFGALTKKIQAGISGLTVSSEDLIAMENLGLTSLAGVIRELLESDKILGQTKNFALSQINNKIEESLNPEELVAMKGLFENANIDVHRDIFPLIYSALPDMFTVVLGVLLILLTSPVVSEADRERHRFRFKLYKKLNAAALDNHKDLINERSKKYLGREVTGFESDGSISTASGLADKLKQLDEEIKSSRTKGSKAQKELANRLVKFQRLSSRFEKIFKNINSTMDGLQMRAEEFRTKRMESEMENIRAELAHDPAEDKRYLQDRLLKLATWLEDALNTQSRRSEQQRDSDFEMQIRRLIEEISNLTSDLNSEDPDLRPEDNDD